MAGETDFADKEKSLFLTQIWYLEEQLASCQLIIKDLKKQNEDLASQYAALQKTKKEKTERLKERTGAQEKRVEGLSRQLEEQKQAAEQERDTRLLQQQRQQQRKQELLELIGQYHVEHTELTAALVEKEQRTTILRQQVSDVEAAEKQIANLRQEQDADIHRLKMKTESDANKLDESLRGELMELSEPDRAVRILERDSAKYRTQMKTVQFLQSVRSRVVEDLGVLRSTRADLESSKQSLTEKTDVLMEQKATLEKEVNQLWQTFRQLTRERAELLGNLSGAQSEAETLRRRLARNPVGYRQVVRMERLEAELQKEAVRRRRLEEAKQKAADFVERVLLDPGEPSEAQWRTRRLVEILKDSRTESTSNGSAEQSGRGQKTTPLIPK